MLTNNKRVHAIAIKLFFECEIFDRYCTGGLEALRKLRNDNPHATMPDVETGSLAEEAARKAYVQKLERNVGPPGPDVPPGTWALPPPPPAS